MPRDEPLISGFLERLGASIVSVAPARTPVLVGIGQSIERDAITSAVDLATRASEAAVADAPGLREKVQRLSLVGISFSRAGSAPASEIAGVLGLGDIARETTTGGGQTPQWLMNRACEQIAQGELETTLLCGAEATRSMKLEDPDQDFLVAASQGEAKAEGPADTVVGTSVRGLVGKALIEAGLMRPAEVYPVLENALSAKSGASPAEARARIAAFYSRASETAAKNPYAWFQQVRTPDEIAEPSSANRMTAEPYTLSMNSFANVDQGAALLITTLANARAAGLEDQCVYPWAGASSRELTPAQRPDLASSPAIRAAASAAFRAAGIGLDDVDFIDLYSCFPIAVEIGATEIGLSLDDPRGLTQTGFMSFFGGPGNNYNSHGIAAVALRLRESGRFGYVSGNGGLLSKHSIGIYGSDAPPQGFAVGDTSAAQRALEAASREVVHEADGSATVVAGTVVYGRDGAPRSAPVIADLPDGRRIVAKASDETLANMSEESLEGQSVRVTGAHPPVYAL
jgi:acetyl-CoA C-acetyltransferase